LIICQSGRSLSWGISGVVEEVSAFLGRDGVEDLPDGVADGVGCAGGGLAQEVLELGEELFDRVQIGEVFRQEDEPGPARPVEPAVDRNCDASNA